MPALSLFLLYCRDRANCMDGLIETVFLPRNRLIRAFADGGPGVGGDRSQGSLRNVPDVVTATLPRARHPSRRAHNQFRRRGNPHRHACRWLMTCLPIRRFDQLAQQRHRQVGDFDSRHGDCGQRGPRFARQLNIGDADHGQITRHVQAKIGGGVHRAERRQIVGREDRGEFRIGFQQRPRRGVAALYRIGRMLDPSFRRAGRMQRIDKTFVARCVNARGLAADNRADPPMPERRADACRPVRLPDENRPLHMAAPAAHCGRSHMHSTTGVPRDSVV